MKGLHVFILASCVGAFCQGCGKTSSETAHHTAPKKLRLAFVTNSTNDFWAIVRHGCDSAAQSLDNVDVDFHFLTNSTVEAQEEIVSALVERRVNGIAISPIDGEKETDFLNQVAAKTLLVCVDSDAVNSKRVCFIGSDNVTAGKQAAELLRAALPQGGKIVLCVGYPNAQNAKDRIKGLQDGLTGSDIQIIDTLADTTKTDVARKNAQDALDKHPDLAGMVGLYSYNGPAILSAVRGAGKAGKVKIVCFDDDNDTLAGVAAGDIYGTVVQVSAWIGNRVVISMDKYLGGDKTELSKGNIAFKTIVVDKSRVETFQAWRQAMLQP
jgi:ribose transport system substrate-binding protein